MMVFKTISVPQFIPSFSVRFALLFSVLQCLANPFVHFTFGHCVVCPSSIYGF